MSRLSHRFRNLVQYKNTSVDELEAAATASRRPVRVEIDDDALRAASATITMATGHSFDVSRARGAAGGLWATLTLDEKETRFLPWASIASIRLLNSKKVVACR